MPRWVQDELPFSPALPRGGYSQDTSPLRSAESSSRILEALVQELESQIRKLQHALAELKR